MQLPAFITKRDIFFGIISLLFLFLSLTITVLAAPPTATKFVIINPTDGTIGTPITITVQAQKANNQIDTTYQSDVTLITSGSATGGGLVNIVNGVGTIIINDSVAETVNLSLSDTQGTGLNVSSVQDVVFAPLPATKFVIINPTDGFVGTPITVTVQAQNSLSQVVTTYQNDVTLVTSGSATGGGLVNIVNGVGTININDTVAETVNLSLSDTQGTGLDVSSVQDVVFSPLPATKFVIINPTDGFVGTPITVTVQAQNSLSQIVTTYQSDVTLLTSGSATGEGLVNIVNGVGTLSINDSVAETVTLSLSDTQGTGLDVSSVRDVIFSPLPATKFVIINPSDSTVGTPVVITVQAQNSVSEIVTTYQNDVTLVTNGSATGAGLVNIINGVGTLSINDSVAETVTLSLSDTQGTGLDVSSVQDVIFSTVAAVATKFVIINPANGTVGTPITITIQAQKNDTSVDTDYQNDVTLVTDGSATGAGIVDIINGVGTISINDSVAETVTLSLSDTQGTGLDVSSVQDVIFSAIPSPQENTLALCSDSIDNDSDGLIDLDDPDCVAFVPAPMTQDQTVYGGGGLNPVSVIVNISGKVYPGAKLTIFEKSSLSIELKKQEITVAENGYFGVTYDKLVADYYTYSLLVKDKEGQQTQIKVFNIDLLHNSSTNIQNIFFPPTINLTRTVVKKGDSLKVFGYAFPGNKVEIESENNKIYEAQANEKGVYELLINTANLKLGSYKMKAKQLDPNRRESGFSLSKSFVVSESTVVNADFNGDGKINVSDWSIFLLSWGQKKQGADLNSDGKIDISDFSVFLKAI